MISEVLVELHRQAGDHAALAEGLADLAARVDDPARLASLYVERGDLLRLHLNRADDAAGAYALALGCQPESRDALAGLVDVYRAQERSAELAEALGRLARLEPDRRDAGLLWLELGRLQARVLARPEAAIGSFEAALGALPADVEALRALGDLHFEAGRHEAALLRYSQLATLYTEEGYDEPSAPFLRRLAAAQVNVGRLDEALATLEQAVREDPDDVATCEQAQDVLLRTGDVERIAWFFQHALEGARRPAARAFLARRAGRVLWRELRRPAEAAPLLDVALAVDPGDVDVMRIRLEVATALGDWPTVAGLPRGQLAVAPAVRRPGLLVRLARLAASELHQPDEARRLARAALEDRPDYEPARALLAELAQAAEVAGAADPGAAARRAAGPPVVEPAVATPPAPPSWRPPSWRPLPSWRPSRRGGSSPSWWPLPSWRPPRGRPRTEATSPRPRSAPPPVRRTPVSGLRTLRPPAPTPPGFDPLEALPSAPSRPAARPPSITRTRRWPRRRPRSSAGPDAPRGRSGGRGDDAGAPGGGRPGGADTDGARAGPPGVGRVPPRRAARPRRRGPGVRGRAGRGPASSGVWLEALEALEDLHALRQAWDAVLALYDRRGPPACWSRASGPSSAPRRCGRPAASRRPSTRRARPLPAPRPWPWPPSCSRRWIGRRRRRRCCRRRRSAGGRRGGGPSLPGGPARRAGGSRARGAPAGDGLAR
ncbi:MAG: tetratricopeptide repeat protein [bacterium]